MAGSGSAEQTLLTTASSNYARSHPGPMGAPVSLRVDDGALRDQELPWPGALPVVSGSILGGNMPCRGGHGNLLTPSQHLTQATATQPMQASASKPVQQRALLPSTTQRALGHCRGRGGVADRWRGTGSAARTPCGSTAGTRPAGRASAAARRRPRRAPCRSRGGAGTGPRPAAARRPGRSSPPAAWRPALRPSAVRAAPPSVSVGSWRGAGTMVDSVVGTGGARGAHERAPPGWCQVQDQGHVPRLPIR